MIVYISIGNSDDKLTQRQWADFCNDAETLIAAAAKQIHGAWTSATRDPWQNACWCVEVWPHLVDKLRADLAWLADRYRQDSIAWAVAETEFIQAAPRDMSRPACCTTASPTARSCCEYSPTPRRSAMGTSTDAMLVYGYHLGGGDGDWLVSEVDDDGYLTMDWYNSLPGDDDDPPDFVEYATERLLADAGFTETDWHADGYFDRRHAAEERIGVEFETHCSGSYTMYLLVAKTFRASRGDTDEIDPVALIEQPVRHGWDAKLRHACEVLGISPRQDRPKWLLCSWWSS